MSRYQSLAFYGGRVYVPTLGKAPSGLFHEIDPVAIVQPDHALLSSVLTERLASEPRRMKEWYRGDPPRKSVVQVAAKSRSWIGFARKSLRFALIETGEHWQVSVSEGPTRTDVETSLLQANSLPTDLASVILAVAHRRRIWA